MPIYAAPLDLTRNELRNAKTQNLASAPAAGASDAGLRYYDTVLFRERYWDGGRWVDVIDAIDAANITGLGDLALLDQVGAAEIAPLAITDAHVSATAAIQLSKLAVDPLARANHTGSQLAATISDFDAQVRTNRLDQMAVPTATVDLGGQILTNVADPVNPSDVANKAYADALASGIDVHTACRVATTANINLAATTTIDGVTLSDGDRILVKNQTSNIQNGIYVHTAGALTRSVDADATGEIDNGTYVLITAGTTNMNTGWICTSSNPVVDTDPIVFVQFSAGGSQYTGTANRITVTGTQIDIAATYVGQASITTLGTVTAGTWQGTPVGLAYGGTGATTAAGARAALGAIGKFPATGEHFIGNGVSLGPFTVAHNLNTMVVGVELYEVATHQTVYADVKRTDANNISIEGFSTAPTNNGLGVVVWG